jgi:hypothetical protein
MDRTTAVPVCILIIIFFGPRKQGIPARWPCAGIFPLLVQLCERANGVVRVGRWALNSVCGLTYR